MIPFATLLTILPLAALPFWPANPSPPDVRPPEAEAVRVWGLDGHRMAARAAVDALPGEIPGFFREGADVLVWLNPEPDRWRDRRFPEMDEAWRYDHYIDLENIPGCTSLANCAILNESTDRWDFFERLVKAGVENPKVAVGFAPFGALELHQRLQASFARWRNESDPMIRGFLETRILQDAGVLGHFIMDLSQPHHTTIHFNGWDEAQVPNPEGYTTDRGFHSRFESRFVQTHVRPEHVSAFMTRGPQVVGDAREAIFTYVWTSNSEVERLYQIDRDHGFGPESPPAQESLDFAASRIAEGALMLRDLWWSAWVSSEATAAGPGGGGGG
jgi:hypothetical protein